MTDLTVVTKVKTPPDFRDVNWVKGFLDSIKDQVYSVKVILINYGSQEKYRKDLRQLVKGYNISYIETKKGTVNWNCGRASNIGIKRVNTKYTMLTDIDCLFDKNFTEIVHYELKKADNFKLKRIILSRVYELNKDGSVGEIHKKSDVGSCIALPTKWLKKVRGFDENYKGWGLEDLDLVQRAISDNFTELWIHGPTNFYHRSHPKPEKISIKHNKIYFDKHFGLPIARNNNGWGLL